MSIKFTKFYIIIHNKWLRSLNFSTTKPGRTVWLECSACWRSESFVAPVKTSRVWKPHSWPNLISVSKLSPIKRTLLASWMSYFCFKRTPNSKPGLPKVTALRFVISSRRFKYDPGPKKNRKMLASLQYNRSGLSKYLKIQCDPVEYNDRLLRIETGNWDFEVTVERASASKASD